MWFWIDGIDSHFLHIASYELSSNKIALIDKVAGYSSSPPGRVIHVDSIDKMFNLYFTNSRALLLVVKTATIKFKELTLSGYR